MSVDINKVFVAGNLTRDPELKYAPSGTAICKLGLAVNRRYKTGQGEQREETSFFDVTVFGRSAETVDQYMEKGRAVLVEGRLKQDRWESQEGQRRSKVEIIADRVHFLGGGGQRNDGGQRRRRDQGSYGGPGDETLAQEIGIDNEADVPF